MHFKPANPADFGSTTFSRDSHEDGRSRSVTPSDPFVSDRRLLTIREAAGLLRVSPSTIRNAIRAGRLRAFRFGIRGGSIRIGLADLDDYQAACATTPPPMAKAQAGSAAGSTFKCLDAKRLLAAWRQQGALAGQPSGRSAQSFLSSDAP